jgi:thiamine-phosphate pyrophosphorylase
VINDRLDVARALGLGAHLGGRSVSVPDARALLGLDVPLSVACHDEAEIARARDDGASYALVSPVFDVPGKGVPLGLAGLARLVAVAGALPVLALGGVDEASAPACFAHGAVGFAAIRAFLPGITSHR